MEPGSRISCHGDKFMRKDEDVMAFRLANDRYAGEPHRLRLCGDSHTAACCTTVGCPSCWSHRNAAHIVRTYAHGDGSGWRTTSPHCARSEQINLRAEWLRTTARLPAWVPATS